MSTEPVPRNGNGHILNPPHLSDILRAHGSFRRLMENYWTGRLSVMEEAVIEDKYPRETLVSYKPVTVKPESLRLDSVDTVVEILEAVMTTSHADAHFLGLRHRQRGRKEAIGPVQLRRDATMRDGHLGAVEQGVPLSEVRRYDADLPRGIVEPDADGNVHFCIVCYGLYSEPHDHRKEQSQ